MKQIVRPTGYLRNIVLIGTLAMLFGPVLAQSPLKKVYTTDQLRRDFGLMRRALEEAHPGLYRYQPRDSVNRTFEAVAQQLNRAMTESEFQRVIHPVITQIGCGHTSLEYSKAVEKYRNKHKIKPLPISPFLTADNRLFVWRNQSTDSLARPGSEITHLNGQTVRAIQEQIYQRVSSDGYNETFKRLVLNLRFDKFFRYVTSYEGDSLAVTLRDSLGNTRQLLLRPKPTKKTKVDSLTKPQLSAKPKKAEKPIKRTLTFSDKDSTVAVLTLNTFSGGGQYRFFRRSFRALAAQQRAKTLILDLRANGGGSSDACTNLLRYLIDQPFQAYREGDAPVRQVSFNRHLTEKFDRFIGRHFFTVKTPTGTYRRRGVGKVYAPIEKTGFHGRILVLTSGNTFSAAAIVSSLLLTNERDRTTFVGRETGGGQYGCNGFVMPFLRLPETGVRLRFPLYKISLPVTGIDNGRGVMPDFPISPTIQDVLASKDVDMAKALELAKSAH
jgi:C-terminal processing protease CtpA/Prc